MWFTLTHSWTLLSKLTQIVIVLEISRRRPSCFVRSHPATFLILTFPSLFQTASLHTEVILLMSSNLLTARICRSNANNFPNSPPLLQSGAMHECTPGLLGHIPGLIRDHWSPKPSSKQLSSTHRLCIHSKYLICRLMMTQI